MTPNDHPSPMTASGDRSKRTEEHAESMSTIDLLRMELYLEEQEMDRVHSLGFSGPQFEAYKAGLQTRIDELLAAIEHVKRLENRHR